MALYFEFTQLYGHDAIYRVFALWRAILFENPYVFVHTMQSKDPPVPLQKPFDADFDKNSQIRQGSRQKEVVLTKSLTDHFDTAKAAVNSVTSPLKLTRNIIC